MILQVLPVAGVKQQDGAVEAVGEDEGELVVEELKNFNFCLMYSLDYSYLRFANSAMWPKYFHMWPE